MFEVGHAGGDLARDYADAGYPEEISDYLPTGAGPLDLPLPCLCIFRDCRRFSVTSNTYLSFAVHN